MKKTLSLSLAAILALHLGGCSSREKTVDSPIISNYLNGTSGPGADNNLTVEAAPIKQYLAQRNIEQSKMLAEAKSSEFRYFNIRSGDTAKEVFGRLGEIDKKIYVVEDPDRFEAAFAVNGLRTIGDVKSFFLANDYRMEVKPIQGSDYIKVSLLKKENELEKTLMKIPVSLSGMPSPIEAIDTIAQSAGIGVEYKDKAASDVGSIHRRISFSGNGLDAIRQLASKAGLMVEFEKERIVLSYFSTETMNVDIFMRDRNMKSIISNVPTSGSVGAENSLAANQQSGIGTSQTTNGATAAMGQDLSVAYSTKLFRELRDSIESSLSKYGSYSFLPTTGQVIVRDKAENVRTVQKIISDFNSKFKDTITGRITFYKVSMDKTDKRGLDIKAAIGKYFSLDTAGAMSTTAFSGISSTGKYALGYASNDGDTTALFQFLRQIGNTEVVNSIDFEVQSNSLKTIKVANNYGYISSVTSSVVAGTAGSTTSGGITPSSVPDGTFASLIAKSVGNGTVAFDIYATSNSLAKFNTAEAFGTTVQTPDTAEQSVDGYHQVKAGVPYILLSYKYNESKGSSQGLPVEWEWLQKLGVNVDSDKDVFVIVALEAAVK